jgi:gamma-glutamyltranspeptidase/glutathione hydrolase
MRISNILVLVALCAACAKPATPCRTAPTSAGLATSAAAPVAPKLRGLPAHDPGQAGVAVGVHGAVTSAEGNASRVGLGILQRGGNAVDAAIAVAFALAVTHPSAGNLGGGGFMLVRMADGTATAIDYRETAPAAATPNMYLDKDGAVSHDSLVGARAAGVPGTVAGMALAHKRFGHLPWAELVAPAVALARDGHAPDAPHLAELTEGVQDMRKAGFEESARAYLGADGKPLQAGQVWHQPELAATLDSIATQGPRAFYEGALADALAGGIQKLGGLWTVDDLRNYKAVERTPIAFAYRGHGVLSMPPPSSGGIVLRQILGASELLDLKSLPWRSIEALHLYVEAARRAFADRSELLGDPDFVKVPTATLTSMDYIRERMKNIDRNHATPSTSITGGLLSPESSQTTHFSIVDDFGNAVSNTYTLNESFGARLVIPGTGVLLNDEMDDFAAKPGAANSYGLVQSARNAIAPGKRMLSSMTPTIVTKDGELRAIVGSPGGPTIINTVAQIVLAIIDHDRTIDEAVRAPRLHHQWKPDAIRVEAAFEPGLEAGLRALGHEVMHREDIGHANCIEVDPTTKGFRAVADVARRGGEAVAY